MCAGDVVRPIYSQLFASHFEPLSALNLLQENPLKDPWHKEAAQDARNENKPKPPIEFVAHLGETQNNQLSPAECNVTSIPEAESSNPTQKDSNHEQYAKFDSDCNNGNGRKILVDPPSPPFSAITCNLENVNTSIQRNNGNTFPLEVKVNSLSTATTQKEISVNIHVNTTESESKTKFKDYFLINSSFKKLCNFSRRKEKNINSSQTVSLRLSRRRLRNKSEYRYCDANWRSSDKKFLFNYYSKLNFSPNRRYNRKHIKYQKKFEFISENFQRFLRNNSDLHANERKQASVNNDKNLRFSGRKQMRRNSLSHISLGDKNKPQNDTKTTQRKIDNDINSSSMEEYYSSKFKTRRKSLEFCNESTRNTIKLIDKILEEPRRKYSKPIKSLSFDRTVPKEASQVIITPKKIRSHSTDSECSYKSKASNDLTYSAAFPPSVSVLRRRSSSVTRPASLDMPFQHHNSLSQSNLIKDLDHWAISNEGVSCSLDGLLIGLGGKNDRHSEVNSFLKRLDKVLSDVVEEETKKIVTMKVPCNHELFMDRNYVSSVSYLKRNPAARDIEYATAEAKTQKIKRYKSTDFDLLERHKKCFTESKPHKPRILKTNSQSELLSLKNCYQVTRHKRRKKRASVKNGVEENGSNYKDDFEFYDSSSDINQESSSEQESIEEIINSSPLDKKRVKDEHKIQLNVNREKKLPHDNVNSSFPNNNVGPVLSSHYNGIKESKLPDDEDDTCYGSDQFGSDMMTERLDASKLSRQVKKFSKDCGENSIDSAYTGSREPTPDICSSGSELAVALPKPKLKYNAIKNEKVRSASFVNPADTVVQRMNDAKLYLLEKIKDTGLYSDSNINSLLDYYSRKWHHIPEREMKIIASFIRRDLGVKAPPQTYIDHLLKQSDTTRQFNEEFTTEECVTALSTTLPSYLKVYRDKRKAASTSCSPEPSVFFKSHSNLNNYPGRYYEPFVSTCSSDFSRSNKRSEKMTKSQNEGMNSDSELRKMTARKDNYENFHATKFYSCDASENNGYSLLSNDYDDEEWIRNNVGEDVLEDCKRKISNIKETEPDCKVLSDEVEKLANDMCERFGIVL